MFWYFSAYGLRLRADGAIPGLLGSPQPPQIDLTISFQSTPVVLRRGLEAAEETWCSSSTDESGKPVLRITRTAGGGCVRFLYCDGAEFILNGTGTCVWASWPEQLTLGDVLPYLRGPVLGAVLRLRNIVALHASAISVDGHAIALMGPPESGKSTTAAVFAQRGHPVLSDDVVALKDKGDTFLAHPGYPHLCLWPESVNALYGSENALPRITENWEKRYLDVSGKDYEFARQPQPLATIYILAERSQTSQAPFIEPVTGCAGLIELLANTYVSYFSDHLMRSRDFELLGRVAAQVPIRRVFPHSDPAQLSKMCDRIVEDAKAVIQSFVA